MSSAILTMEGHDGLNWLEFARSAVQVDDFKSLKSRQGTVSCHYTTICWCNKHRIKVKETIIDRQRIRFTLFYQAASMNLLPVTYI